MQGDVLVDIPLSNAIDQHNLNDNSMTVVLKELDMAQKAKFKGGEVAETYDIFGLSDFSSQTSYPTDTDGAAAGTF
jgi:NDP-sugar pyrophosphorylase family protein